MLRDVLNFVEYIANTIDFISCIVIFLGGAYIALHSRVIPRWAATSLWYIGLAALLTAITILIEWTVGPTHPLSHFMVGKVAEVGLLLMMAVTVGLMFFHTVWKDLQGARKRAELEAIALTVKKKPATTRTKRAYKKRQPIKNNDYLEI